jgi:hypothetical protein
LANKSKFPKRGRKAALSRLIAAYAFRPEQKYFDAIFDI